METKADPFSQMNNNNNNAAFPSLYNRPERTLNALNANLETLLAEKRTLLAELLKLEEGNPLMFRQVARATHSES